MTGRVLVADDDPNVRQIVEAILTDAGLECVTASDGEEALERARRTRPDLIVLDVAMPRLSGDEVQARLRAEPATRSVPVMFLSAKGEPQEKTARLLAGADDYVSKPFDNEELLARITAALRRTRELRSLNPLSGLPGNVTIADEIGHRLRAGEDFACLYVDVDGFKSFNDHYGFGRGDELISHMAGLLAEIADGQGFVGHIGGDDFVILVPSDAAEPMAQTIVSRFAPVARDLYDAADRDRGWLETRDRRGRMRRTPLVSVSVGVVKATPLRFSSSTEVARVAAEVKEVAKRTPGSWAMDRRTGDGASETYEIVSAASPKPSGSTAARGT